ncbi:hypothetical protein ACOME3_002115 [Neoechinorhynchus agilis]
MILAVALLAWVLRITPDVSHAAIKEGSSGGGGGGVDGAQVVDTSSDHLTISFVCKHDVQWHLIVLANRTKDLLIIQPDSENTKAVRNGIVDILDYAERQLHLKRAFVVVQRDFVFKQKKTKPL